MRYIILLALLCQPAYAQTAFEIKHKIRYLDPIAVQQRLDKLQESLVIKPVIEIAPLLAPKLH